MIANAFKVLADHQQIQGEAPVCRCLGNHLDQTVFHLTEIIIHHVVMGDDRFCQSHILLHIGVHAVGNHADSGPGHGAEQGAMGFPAALQIAHNLGNVLRLVANALHVGNHFQGGGDLPQVTGHRLLPQQQLQADALHIPLLLIQSRRNGRHLGGQRRAALRQSFHRQGDGVLTQGAHLGHFLLQQRQLLVKIVPHQPNLPVI